MPTQIDPDELSSEQQEDAVSPLQDVELVEELLQSLGLNGPEVVVEQREIGHRERIQRYRSWFAQYTSNKRSGESSEAASYMRSSGKTILLDGKEIEAFAPFHPELSALKTFTVPQIVIICTAICLWIVGVASFHLAMLTVTIAAITALYAFMLGLNAVMARSSLETSSTCFSTCWAA